VLNLVAFSKRQGKPQVEFSIANFANWDPFSKPKVLDHSHLFSPRLILTTSSEELISTRKSISKFRRNPSRTFQQSFTQTHTYEQKYNK